MSATKHESEPTTIKALGIRADASSFSWAVVEGTKEKPILVASDDATAPKNEKEPAALSWLRKRVNFIIDQYSVAACQSV